jgi:hypothetical protein
VCLCPSSTKSCMFWTEKNEGPSSNFLLCCAQKTPPLPFPGFGI